MKKRLLLITFSVVFIILIILFIKSKTKIKTKPSEEISVSTIQTKYNQISIPIETFGSVIYQTKNEITNLVAGTVIEKKVKEGDYVKQGQILYILKNVELEIQHAQYQNNLNSALANVELYKAKLTEDEQFAKSKLYEIENKKTEISKTTLVIKKLKEQLKEIAPYDVLSHELPLYNDKEGFLIKTLLNIFIITLQYILEVYELWMLYPHPLYYVRQSSHGVS